jgi:hypothetical protein
LRPTFVTPRPTLAGRLRRIHTRLERARDQGGDGVLLVVRASESGGGADANRRLWPWLQPRIKRF